MAIILEAAYSKKLGLPNYSSHSFVVSIRTNRQYLLKAIGFGLRFIGVQEPLKPLRSSDGGSCQMIVMLSMSTPMPPRRGPAS